MSETIILPFTETLADAVEQALLRITTEAEYSFNVSGVHRWDDESDFHPQPGAVQLHWLGEVDSVDGEEAVAYYTSTLSMMIEVYLVKPDGETLAYDRILTRAAGDLRRALFSIPDWSELNAYPSEIQITGFQTVEPENPLHGLLAEVKIRYRTDPDDITRGHPWHK